MHGLHRSEEIFLVIRNFKLFHPPDDTVITFKVTSDLIIVECGRIFSSKETITVDGWILALVRATLIDNLCSKSTVVSWSLPIK